MSNILLEPRKSLRLSQKRKRPGGFENIEEIDNNGGMSTNSQEPSETNTMPVGVATGISVHCPKAGASAQFNDCGILPSE
jgi:hypothetical protein